VWKNLYFTSGTAPIHFDSKVFQRPTVGMQKSAGTVLFYMRERPPGK